MEASQKPLPLQYATLVSEKELLVPHMLGTSISQLLCKNYTCTIDVKTVSQL